MAVIPETLRRTTLGKARPGDRIHFEADVFARYGRAGAHAESAPRRAAGMIVYEPAPAPAARVGEAIVAGRRLAVRLFPYGADAGAAAMRFDPGRSPVRVPQAGCARRGRARQRLDLGRGSRAGALRTRPDRALRSGGGGAGRVSGRGGGGGGVGPAGLPARSASPTGFPRKPRGPRWRSARGAPGAPRRRFPASLPRSAAGLSCGAVFPLLPGWTAEPDFLEALMAAAKAGGAASVTALVPAADGEGRRGIVEARLGVEPSEGEGFFDLVHHGDWFSRIGDRLAEARAAAARHGLAALPPRPGGGRGRSGNASAAARLEELADRLEADEHRAALLYAAVRWIDDSRRDLAAVAREGNFRKVFPFGPDIAGEAEAALREAR